MKVLGGAAAAIGLLIINPANAATPNLEGVWVISQPITDLVPVGEKAAPLTEQGKARYRENKAFAAKRKYDDYDYTKSRCSAPGMPRMMMTPRPFKIFQRPEMVTLAFQWNQLVRQIDLRTNPPKKKAAEEAFPVPTMKGDTTGRWDGNTLVAHTTGLSPDKLLDNMLPNGDQLDLVERLTLVDENTLEERITITDPEMYTKPWDAVITYKRLPDSTYPFPEDICLDRKQDRKGTWP
ncbi:hypothetical protein WSK_1433 [Novosphingobium sp. Rr 2-17]|uniref:hypothetical protein n=1 Tax=Novosphingobium sp. Rr 2-17 TaxID=555793 RepID=UPI0002698B9B|nr:hypothetical protein [Novosphingobium sp. Rr 2-17]EIZ80066.1 hypothetical protein WSK_1433 [Novosphingobium sp. Rr 2-17]